MPKLSNVLICDMPYRFDTYKGCSHACEYCFVKLKTDISKIENNEGPKALLNFINKRRSGETVGNIFDYDIPLHWGGLSDPFQPIEKTRRLSLECLKVFEKTKYPFVISTKSALISEDEYFEILKNCNCAVQFSAVCESYNNFEKGASTFAERISAMKKISNVGKRVIVRAQPLLPKMKNEFISNMCKFMNAGVYGIIVEFMKYKYKANGTIKGQGDYILPLETIKPIFDEIKQAANAKGLKVFAGENRLRQYGDGLNCCGVGDLWQTHTANLNHLLWQGDADLNKYCHKSNIPVQDLVQSTKKMKLFQSITYSEMLNMAMKSKSHLSNFTIDKTAYNAIKNFKPYGTT